MAGQLAAFPTCRVGKGTLRAVPTSTLNLNSDQTGGLAEFIIGRAFARLGLARPTLSAKRAIRSRPALRASLACAVWH